MSSGTIERPESGTIEEISFGDTQVDVTSYIADHDGISVVEIESNHVRIYVNGKLISEAIGIRRR